MAGPYIVDYDAAVTAVKQRGRYEQTFSVETPVPCAMIAATVTEAVREMASRGTRVSAGASFGVGRQTWLLRMDRV